MITTRIDYHHLVQGEEQLTTWTTQGGDLDVLAHIKTHTLAAACEHTQDSTDSALLDDFFAMLDSMMVYSMGINSLTLVHPLGTGRYVISTEFEYVS